MQYLRLSEASLIVGCHSNTLRQQIESKKLTAYRDHIGRYYLAAPVVLADPIDLNKMLDIPPGLTELPGVASMLMKYYARNG